jgi:hypothetical protein
MNHAIWVNALGFQCVWWALALSVPNGQGWIGISVALTYVFGQLRYTNDQPQMLRAIALTAGLGLVGDTALAQLTNLVFMPVNPAPLSELQPWWLFLLWISLGCTLQSSLKWLCKWPKLSVVLSAFAGVISYKMAIPIGLMQWQGVSPYWILIFVWALCFPVLLFAVNGHSSGRSAD